MSRCTKRQMVFAFLGCVCAVAAVATSLDAAEPVTGSVDAVTLYRGQALVTRTVPVEGKKGPQELVVAGLPEQTQTDSLFAEAGDALEVRAVRFRTRAVGEEPREEVRKLDMAIQETNDNIAAVQKHLQTLRSRIAFLDRIEGFVAGAGKTDLDRGVLDAEDLKEIATFSFENRQAIVEEELAANKRLRELNEELSLLARKRSELTRGASKTVREALIFLDKKADGPASLRLNYLVNGCGWSPTYTIAAENGAEEVRVEYDALIYQVTGEDWDGVALTLSTASPALSAAGPGLAPFHVSLLPAGSIQLGADVNNDLLGKMKQARQGQQAALDLNRNALSLGANITSGWRVNAAATEIQSYEMLGETDVVRQFQKEDASADDNGPSLSYALAGPVSLASRSDQQLVRIATVDLPANFYHVATPILSSHVFREAELDNKADHDLLAGPANVYLDGRFVGRTEVPTVARGQTFVVGFGADPQLKCSRLLTHKQEDVQGGNRELNFTYQLIVENFKDEPTPVRLFDRMPYSDRESEIRIKFHPGETDLSEDDLYVSREKPKGILRWDVTVPAAAHGASAFTVEYSFTCEFDRSKQIGNPLALRAAGNATDDALPAAAEQLDMQLQGEFEELYRGRLAH